MIKLLIGLLTVGLLAFIGYYRYGSEPLSPRSAIENGIEQVKKSAKLEPEQEQLLKVQLAISDYMAIQGQAPAALADLVPKYFDQEPKNLTTGQPYPYHREGKMPRLGAQGTKAAGNSSDKNPKVEVAANAITGDGIDFVNPNTLEADSFVYDKTGRRDPFEPFDFAATPVPVAGGTITTYTLGQLRLTAVVVGPTGERKGIVEDDQGRGYTVSNGTHIGSEGGVVISVEPASLKIVITKVDFTGKQTQSEVEMKINMGRATGVKSPPRKGASQVKSR